MGRSDDVFHLPKHDGGTELVVPDLIRRAIMQMSDEITDYIKFKIMNQIEIQLRPDNLEDLSMTGFNNLWQSKHSTPGDCNQNPHTRTISNETEKNLSTIQLNLGYPRSRRQL